MVQNLIKMYLGQFLITGRMVAWLVEFKHYSRYFKKSYGTLHCFTDPGPQ